jgi:hypothetical protein
MTKEELENYVPKGELIGFPKEVIARMLECQEEQGNKRDVSIFEKNITEGFIWGQTKESDFFWYEVISNKDFNLFFEKYPKKEDNQVFRVGDKVYDIILGKIGIVKEINLQEVKAFRIAVIFENHGTIFYTIDYTIEGKSSSIDKYPRLLHYRDDYNYDIIDFNNLPKRQEPKRWRAKKGELYYLIHLEDMGFCRGANLDKYNEDDNEYYEYGNYFKTKEQAQEVADELNKYFNQLINK